METALRYRLSILAMLCALGTWFWSPLQASAAVRPLTQVGRNLLPTGLYITPLITPGSSYQRLSTGLRPDGTADANGAITSALSPDRKTLLVLTSGYNANFFTTGGTPITVPFLDPNTGQPNGKTTSTFQWVFVYDVSGRKPIQKQRITATSSFDGLTWDPSGTRFYASAGQDDQVFVYKNTGGQFMPDAPFVVLGHGPNSGNNYNSNPQVAGLNVSADGTQLFVANYNNDSVSVVDTTTRKVVSEITIPGKSDWGGDFPIWVTPHAGPSGTTDKFYVSSSRDGCIYVISASGGKCISVGGEPGKSLLSGDGTRLYVVNPNLDQVEQIETASDTLTRTIDVRRANYRYYGANPNALALDHSGRTLYVTIAGENAIGVIDVRSWKLLGRIPTAWYPSSVDVVGTRLFVTNMKSNTGPNPFNDPPAQVAKQNTTYRNDYDLALEKGGLETMPIPDAPTLSYLTAIVDANNAFDSNHGVTAKMQYLRTKIKHVIFIQRENRTYDQVLGDLPEGNGDPHLTLFPRRLTPNVHALAMKYADLDNFYTAGDVSGDGWNWNFEGYSNDINRQGTTLRYAGDGNLQSPIFGGINVGGATDVYGNHAVEDNAGTSDFRSGATGGYLWDDALRAGVSFRHYALYLSGPETLVRHANRVGAKQGYPQYASLANWTNRYFYQWDTRIPDEWRYEVWKDQFDQDVKNHTMPAFEFMCIMMDHTGDFNDNVAGLNTPQLDVASNDHAIGQIVDAVSHSPLWASTAIFIVEDDSQNGPDHIDAHRSPALIISPYTQTNIVDHTFYSTINVDRTMEDLLGMDHLGFNDANAVSMDDVFSTQPNLQPYEELIPGALCKPPVDPKLVPECFNPAMRSRITAAIAPLHNGQWWIDATKGLSFRHPDEIDASYYNRLLWTGIIGDSTPYPGDRAGLGISRATASDR